MRAYINYKLINDCSYIYCALVLVFDLQEHHIYVHTLRGSLEDHTLFQTKRVYPFSDHNGLKTLLDGAAHTYMVNIREHPPGVRAMPRFVSFRTPIQNF